MVKVLSVRRCLISSLDLIDGRGPGFPRPREAKNFEPFFLGGCQEADAKRRMPRGGCQEKDGGGGGGGGGGIIFYTRIRERMLE